MKISLNWLREFIQIDIEPEKIAELLTLKGIEVSDVYPVGRDLQKIICAKIIRIRKHPNADNLYICDTDTGERIIPVICSAPNIKEGLVSALALPGTVLPDGRKIKKAKIRGEISEGMFLAEDELSLTDDHTGIIELPDDTKPGTPLPDVLPVEDFVLDVEITPNRGDCASVLGIAREISAATGKKISFPEIDYEESEEEAEKIAKVKIEEPERCRRYCAGIIRDVKIASSPFLIRYRLYLSGIRAINNVVDITNYVMLELGQPLHAFDLQRIKGREIIVRCAREGEKIRTLDGEERDLSSEVLLICDRERPVAVAGIMGGQETEIQEGTKDVLLEAAFFDPITIRRGSKKLCLSTEASYRFERGVDIENVPMALKRAMYLMQKLAGGRIAKGIIDNYPRPYKPKKIILRIDKANSFLGTSLSSEKISSYLKALHMDVKKIDSKNIEVIPPSFRMDIKREVDLFEEIARLYGYENIPVTLPYIKPSEKEEDTLLKLEGKVREIMIGMGFSEIITYSFISPEYKNLLSLSEDPIKLANPLSTEQSVMRTSLIPGILETIRTNISYGERDLKLFEVGRVFIKKKEDELPEEVPFLVAAQIGLSSKKTWYSEPRKVDFYDIKGCAESFLKSISQKDFSFRRDNKIPPYYEMHEYAGIYTGDHLIGHVGKISSRITEKLNIEEDVYIMEINLRDLSEYFIEPVRFKPFSRFPAVYRDISVVVKKSTETKLIEDIIRKIGGELVESVHLFDLYEGGKIKKDEKAVAFRIWFRSMKGTLEKKDVDVIYEKMIKEIIEKTGGRLREA